MLHQITVDADNLHADAENGETRQSSVGDDDLPELLPSEMAALEGVYFSTGGINESNATEFLQQLQIPTDESFLNRFFALSRRASGGESLYLTLDEARLLVRLCKQKFERESSVTDNDEVCSFAAIGGSDDRTGFIHQEELKILCASFGLGIDIDKFMADVDTDGSGRVEFEEFMQLLKDDELPLSLAQLFVELGATVGMTNDDGSRGNSPPLLPSPTHHGSSVSLERRPSGSHNLAMRTTELHSLLEGVAPRAVLELLDDEEQPFVDIIGFGQLLRRWNREPREVHDLIVAAQKAREQRERLRAQTARRSEDGAIEAAELARSLQASQSASLGRGPHGRAYGVRMSRKLESVMTKHKHHQAAIRSNPAVQQQLQQLRTSRNDLRRFKPSPHYRTRANTACGACKEIHQYGRGGSQSPPRDGRLSPRHGVDSAVPHRPAGSRPSSARTTRRRFEDFPTLRDTFNYRKVMEGQRQAPVSGHRLSEPPTPSPRAGSRPSPLGRSETPLVARLAPSPPLMPSLSSRPQSASRSRDAFSGQVVYARDASGVLTPHVLVPMTGGNHMSDITPPPPPPPVQAGGDQQGRGRGGATFRRQPTTVPSHDGAALRAPESESIRVDQDDELVDRNPLLRMALRHQATVAARRRIHEHTRTAMEHTREYLIVRGAALRLQAIGRAFLAREEVRHRAYEKRTGVANGEGSMLLGPAIAISGVDETPANIDDTNSSTGDADGSEHSISSLLPPDVGEEISTTFQRLCRGFRVRRLMAGLRDFLRDTADLDGIFDDQIFSALATSRDPRAGFPQFEELATYRDRSTRIRIDKSPSLTASAGGSPLGGPPSARRSRMRERTLNRTRSSRGGFAGRAPRDVETSLDSSTSRLWGASAAAGGGTDDGSYRDNSSSYNSNSSHRERSSPLPPPPPTEQTNANLMTLVEVVDTSSVAAVSQGSKDKANLSVLGGSTSSRRSKRSDLDSSITARSDAKKAKPSSSSSMKQKSAVSGKVSLSGSLTSRPAGSGGGSRSSKSRNSGGAKHRDGDPRPAAATSAHPNAAPTQPAADRRASPSPPPAAIAGVRSGTSTTSGSPVTTPSAQSLSMQPSWPSGIASSAAAAAAAAPHRTSSGSLRRNTSGTHDGDGTVSEGSQHSAAPAARSESSTPHTTDVEAFHSDMAHQRESWSSAAADEHDAVTGSETRRSSTVSTSTSASFAGASNSRNDTVAAAQWRRNSANNLSFQSVGSNATARRASQQLDDHAGDVSPTQTPRAAAAAPPLTLTSIDDTTAPLPATSTPGVLRSPSGSSGALPPRSPKSPRCLSLKPSRGSGHSLEESSLSHSNSAGAAMSRASVELVNPFDSQSSPGTAQSAAGTTMTTTTSTEASSSSNKSALDSSAPRMSPVPLASQMDTSSTSTSGSNNHPLPFAFVRFQPTPIESQNPNNRSTSGSAFTVASAASSASAAPGPGAVAGGPPLADDMSVVYPPDCSYLELHSNAGSVAEHRALGSIPSFRGKQVASPPIAASNAPVAASVHLEPHHLAALALLQRAGRAGVVRRDLGEFLAATKHALEELSFWDRRHDDVIRVQKVVRGWLARRAFGRVRARLWIQESYRLLDEGFDTSSICT